MARVARRFARVEPRRRARAFVLGLLANLPRKNCWTIAEHAGDESPAGMQHLFSCASWDADQVRDDIRAFVEGHLDRRLYIPRSWTQDPDRCRAAGIPDDLRFATKPALATEMIAQALDADVLRRGWPVTRSTAATRT